MEHRKRIAPAMVRQLVKTYLDAGIVPEVTINPDKSVTIRSGQIIQTTSLDEAHAIEAGMDAALGLNPER
ncbi:hypothetical protein [Oceanicaulis sp.]|uniref:hypothetical protein n=1 Tax=Oceanicaulis sp. TaxID=1924941 RepID=UPI003F7088A7